MAIKFWQSGSDSDLGGGADYSKKLVAVEPVLGSVLPVTVAVGAVETSYAFTEPGIPDTGGATGDFAVDVYVTQNAPGTLLDGMYLAVQLARVDSGGTVQSQSSVSTEADAEYGISLGLGYTRLEFSFPALDLGTWSAGDRLRVSYLWHNTAASDRTFEISTLYTTVDTPFTAPDTTVYLWEPGSDSASGVAEAEIAVAAVLSEPGVDTAAGHADAAIAIYVVLVETGSDAPAVAIAALVTVSASLQESGIDTAVACTDVAVSLSVSVSESASDTVTGSASALCAASATLSESGSDTCTAPVFVVVSSSASVQETGSDSIHGAVAVSVLGTVSLSEAGEDTVHASAAVLDYGTQALLESGSDSVATAAMVTVTVAVVLTETSADTLTGTAATELGVHGQLYESGSDRTTAVASVSLRLSSVLAREAGIDRLISYVSGDWRTEVVYVQRRNYRTRIKRYPGYSEQAKARTYTGIPM